MEFLFHFIQGQMRSHLRYAGHLVLFSFGVRVYYSIHENADWYQVCEAALRTLASYGDVIPQEYLNAIASEGSEWSRDVAVTIFTDVGLAFIQLLRGEMTTDAATSPVI